MLDRRLSTTIALFRSDYNGLQDSQNVVTPTGAIISRIANIGRSRSQGVEFGASLRLGRDLTLRADLAHLDAKYLSYPDAPCSPIQSAQTTPCTQDLSGRRQAFAPTWTGSVSADYEHDVFADWRLGLGGTAYFATDYYQQSALSDLVRQPSATKLDIRASLSSADDGWRFAVIAKNVTDKLTAGFRNYTPGAVGSVTALVDRPRSVAFQISRRW